MKTFFDWWQEKERVCEPVTAWLNANAQICESGGVWNLWHSGGGCYHYRLNGTYRGQNGYFLLCHESVAEPVFYIPDQPYWMLGFYVEDGDGETVDIIDVASGLCDLRDCIAAAKA